jgi:DNA-binding MarR family transcriptional regulator
MANFRTVNIFGALVLSLHDQIRHDIDSAVGTIGEAAAAAVVIGNFPHRSMNSLSQALSLSHSAVVRIVNGLVGKGLARRSRGASDERISELTLTAAGARKAKAMLGMRHKVIADALDTLSAVEQDQLRSITERLLAAIATEERAGPMCRLCDESSCPRQTCPIAVKLGCTSEH